MVQVGEPSVPDTIQILRGLKQKYEDHHGVHITDRALVVAAELSDRYITARFLPDKAIDLVDEACSTVRVQLDSKPESIDSLERQAVRLRVEREALKKEKDPLSAARLAEVDKELASLEDQLAPLLVGGGRCCLGGGVGGQGVWGVGRVTCLARRGRGTAVGIC